MSAQPQRSALPRTEIEDPMALPHLGQVGEDATVAEVEREIDRIATDLAMRWSALSPPDDYPRELSPDTVLTLLTDFLTSGGKRLRPRMAHWGWAAAGGVGTGQEWANVVTAATALELLHAFALVHDDVMDGSEERRGRASVHARTRDAHHSAGACRSAQQYGQNIAVLVGDLLHSEADAVAAALPAPMRDVWRTLSVELIAGQARDLVGAANGRRDLPHARSVARCKSGAYTVWRPLQLGAVAAGADADTLAALRTFGHHVGEAFALRDDILGVVGDPARTGKPVGDDIVAGKPTVLLALAERRFSASARLALRRAGNESCTPIQAGRLADELVRSGVIAEVEGMIEASVYAASRALDHPQIPSEAAEGLRDLAARVAWRES